LEKRLISPILWEPSSVKNAMIKKLSAFFPIFIIYLGMFYCTTELVECKASLALTVINKRSEAIRIKLENRKQLWYGDSVPLAYPDSVIIAEKEKIIEANGTFAFQLDFKFINEDRCAYMASDREDFSVLAKIWVHDTLFAIDTIYPWDKSMTLKDFCRDCVALNFDTLIVQ
jgi:hypothetical protein